MTLELPTADYAAYRVAGELLGRLQESLGCGELSMFASTVDSVVVMSYRWTFVSTTTRYGITESFPLPFLKSLVSVEDFADVLSRKWTTESHHERNEQR